MTILEAFLQGLLQGLTEFLPVSSSGHLSLFQYFTGNNNESGFLFSILLHAGTLIAVIICFWGTLWKLLIALVTLVRDLLTGKFSAKNMSSARRMLLFLFLSLVPLGLMLLFKDFISGFSTDTDITVEGFCFLLTGAMLLFAAKERPGRKDALTMGPKDALFIGAAQVIATMPGISRSGSTISAGLLCGLERSYAVAYSFILGIPAVLGAIVLEVGDAVREGSSLSAPVIIMGLLSSVIFGILSIKLVQWVVRGNKLKYFGYYTLVLGMVVLTVGAIDHFTGYAVRGFFLGA
ncbi:undecaprenyl-diphosphate phosphatase [Anaerotruncus sp. AF02-27]|uniref:undecaprenyl-diphosphate phosphatase n=1 Tax=Anaerotruncus TaxID=244127 RepID=UPI000E519E0F|nr:MULTISPECIES: undecaprenyl-diphosphate phosphatase [Anaerotruncus]RGX54481.1 undecaprenyl-diphosphate phosphatase [Anaerotruncus sp. AF02-27]